MNAMKDQIKILVLVAIAIALGLLAIENNRRVNAPGNEIQRDIEELRKP